MLGDILEGAAVAVKSFSPHPCLWHCVVVGRRRLRSKVLEGTEPAPYREGRRGGGLRRPALASPYSISPPSPFKWDAQVRRIICGQNKTVAKE